MTTNVRPGRRMGKLTKQAHFAGWRLMLTGRLVSDTEVSLADDAPEGMIWVRADDDSPEEAVAGYVAYTDVYVWVGPGPDGEKRIWAIDYPSNIATWGELIWSLGMPPLVGELSNATWTGQNLKPGRVRASTGTTLDIVVEPLHHAGGYWDGTTLTSVSSYIPSGTSEVRWLVVDLVRATNTLTLTATTATNLYGQYDLPESQAAAVALAPGSDRLGAVVLKTGMTVVDGTTRIIDMRRWADAETDHGGLTGLADDDHLQYVLTTGTRTYTGGTRQRVADGREVDTLTVTGSPSGQYGRLLTYTVDATASDYVGGIELDTTIPSGKSALQFTGLNVATNINGSAGYLYNINSYVGNASASAQTALYAIHGSIVHTGAGLVGSLNGLAATTLSQGPTTNHHGLSVVSNNQAAAGNAYGGEVSMTNSAAVSTGLYGLKVSAISSGSSPTWIGLEVVLSGVGTSSTKYAIRTTGGGISVDGVGIFSGLLTANAALNVTGDITLSNTSKIIGGSSTTAGVTIQTTTGVGATGANFRVLVGNAGATEALTILNNGNVGIGRTGPTQKLDVGGIIVTQGASAPSFAADGSIIAAGTNTSGAAGPLVGVNIPYVTNAFGGLIVGYNNTSVPKWLMGISRGFAAGETALAFFEDSSAFSARFVILPGGNTGHGVNSPTAVVQIKAGAAAASSAPLKFTTGTNLTTPEAGAMEFSSSLLYFTPSATRQLMQLNNYAAKTNTYTVTNDDYVVNCTSGTFTVTLPTAVGIAGKVFIIKDSTGGGVITMATTSGQTIDGAAPGVVTGLLRVMSNGANYITI